MQIQVILFLRDMVTPRKRRVSRNDEVHLKKEIGDVTPRKRRVSRNLKLQYHGNEFFGHASQEACE